jgi:endonuclease YncB( thermonuclease family)
MKYTIILLVLIFGSISANAICEARRHHTDKREELGRKCEHGPDRLKCLDVLNITDGDTLSVNIVGVHPYFGEDTSVRLFGLDTPESRPATVECTALESDHTELDREEHITCLEAKRLRKCEMAASKEATSILEKAICVESDRIDVEFAKDPNGKIIREKYGRILGKILIIKYSGNTAKTTNAQSLLLDRKLAFEYDGGKKLTRDWCNKTLVKDPKLQGAYVKENFCSSRKCTEKTRQVRCNRKKNFGEQMTCYQERISSNIGRWFSSCKKKTGKTRRTCYREKAENYLEFCALYDTSRTAKSCRSEISGTIENYCSGLTSQASEDCLAAI